jgi:membrane protease YdiL (CAAX protease family)
VLFVRTTAAGDVVERYDAADLAAEGGSVSVTAETPVSLREKGPFEPLAVAVATDGAVRDELASGVAIPSLRGHRRLRLALLAATAVPTAALLELDRELVMGGHASAARAVVDVLLAGFVLFELLRRTPRMPGVAALALVAIALRWGIVAARLCGRGVHPLVYAGSLVPALAALVILARVPSRSRVALELLGKLGIGRTALFQATSRPDPPGALLAASVACAAALPAMLHVARSMGAGLFVQALVAVGFAVIAPFLARRATEPSAPRPTRPRPARAFFAIAAGLATTAAAVTAARLFFDAGAEIASCVERLDVETRLARAAESAEIARAVARVRASTPLVAMTVIAFPFAEERVYRGLLQDVLARKYGTAYGVFAAACVFALAHLGVYEVALYQTLLLGIGFGVAYCEGGLLAAFVVHATWNMLRLI